MQWLHEALKSYRKRHKLTQKEVAAKLEITREHYAQIEERKRIPPKPLQDKIATLMNSIVIDIQPRDNPEVQKFIKELFKKNEESSQSPPSFSPIFLYLIKSIFFTSL
jgi:transcriptional regulator with XRE-family HTH domain